MILKYNCILLILGLYLPLNLYSQAINESEIYNWFDAKIGIENTGLYNGIAYNELHRVDNDNNKYLFSMGFQSGSIIYDGQPYYKILMNYNIYDDVVLVELGNEVGTNVFQLLSEKIQSFKSLNTKFIRIKGNPEKNISPGFYEVLLENKLPRGRAHEVLKFQKDQIPNSKKNKTSHPDSYRDGVLNQIKLNKNEGSIKLLKKHKLSERVKLDKKVAVYSYKEKGSEYIVQTSDGFFVVRRKKDFIMVFPDQKDEISHYYRSYRSLRKSNPDKFMIDLTTLAILQNR